MASSIHIQSGHAGSVTHNSRETPTKNSIFSDEKNECSLSSKEAFKLYREELNIRSQAYSNRTNQKLQSKAITHLSAVVNLNQNHKLDDLNALKNHLEKTLDTKVFQVAIHRDEGHINSEMKDVKNYHAHIEFLGLDSEGVSVRKKLTKKYLSDLQTFTAKSLDMQRGKNYASEQLPRPKRLDTYEFKDYKKRETKAIKSQVATIEDLKQQVSTLRAELKENGAVRADYSKLEALNRELKEQIKSKDLTTQQLQERISKLTSTVESKDLKIQELRTTNMQLTTNTIGQDQQVKALQKENETLKKEVYYEFKDGTQKSYKSLAYEFKDKYENFKKEYEKRIEEVKETVKEKYQKLVDSLKTQISTLEAQNESLGVKVYELEEKSVYKQNMNDYEPIKTKEEFLKSPQIIEIQEKIDKLQGKLAVIKDYTQEDYKADLKELKEKYKIPDSVKPSDIAKEYKERTTITKENLRDLNAYAKEQNKSKSQKVLEID